VKKVRRGIIAFSDRELPEEALREKSSSSLPNTITPGPRVPFRGEIAANDAPARGVEKLFAIDGIERKHRRARLLRTAEGLPRQPIPLVLDRSTSGIPGTGCWYRTSTKATDGLLIEARNFRALMLQERYREQVECICIDPPYSTGIGQFPLQGRSTQVG